MGNNNNNKGAHLKKIKKEKTADVKRMAGRSDGDDEKRGEKKNKNTKKELFEWLVYEGVVWSGTRLCDAVQGERGGREKGG